MSDALGESRQIKVGIVLVLQIIVGHVAVPETMDSDSMGEFDRLTNLVVGLIGASGVAAAERVGGRTADIAMLPPDGVKFLLDPAFD